MTIRYRTPSLSNGDLAADPFGEHTVAIQVIANFNSCSGMTGAGTKTAGAVTRAVGNGSETPNWSKQHQTQTKLPILPILL